MKLKKNTAAILFLFCITSALVSYNCKAQDQSFYVCLKFKQLLKVNLDLCDTTLIGLTDSVLTDIAIAPDNRLYGVDFKNLYEIDTATASLTFIANLDQHMSTLAQINSLVSDRLGNLITVTNNRLYQVNRFNGSVIDLGYFGPYISSGDLTFYRDTLYLTTNSNDLIKIIQSPVLTSQLVGHLSINSVYGINTVCLNGVQSIIASAGATNGSLYILDPTTAILTPFCNSLTSSQIYGATSRSDFYAEALCVMSTGTNNYDTQYKIEIFPNPVSDQLHLSVDTDKEVNLVIYDISSRKLIEKKFSRQLSIDVKEFKAGIYFYKLFDNNGRGSIGKWIKD